MNYKLGKSIGWSLKSVTRVLLMGRFSSRIWSTLDDELNARIWNNTQHDSSDLTEAVDDLHTGRVFTGQVGAQVL